jgi:hypothetical protein
MKKFVELSGGRDRPLCLSGYVKNLPYRERGQRRMISHPKSLPQGEREQVLKLDSALKSLSPR